MINSKYEYQHSMNKHEYHLNCNCFYCRVDIRLFAIFGEMLVGPMPCRDNETGKIVNYNENRDFVLTVHNPDACVDDKYNNDWIRITAEDNGVFAFFNDYLDCLYTPDKAEDIQLQHIQEDQEKWLKKFRRARCGE